MVDGMFSLASPLGTVALCVFALLGCLVLPFRDQHGEHAGAGPGVTDVWQLREVVGAHAFAVPDGIAWPDDPVLPDEPVLADEPVLPDEPGLPDEPAWSDEPAWPGEADHAVAVATHADSVVSLERRRARKVRAEPEPYAGRHRLGEIEDTAPTIPVALGPAALRCAA